MIWDLTEVQNQNLIYFQLQRMLWKKHPFFNKKTELVKKLVVLFQSCKIWNHSFANWCKTYIKSESLW